MGLLSLEESAGVIVDGACRPSGTGKLVNICGCAERWILELRSGKADKWRF